MNKHTPGPWTIERAEFEFVVWAHHAEGDPIVCEIGPGTRHLDAGLIAAAPSLLAELEAACLFAEKEATRLSIECGMGASEWESFVPPWFSQSRAAIAKARGQE